MTKERHLCIIRWLTITGVLALVGMAYAFRSFNLNWDENHHLHPDERFLAMVAEAVERPANLRQYLDTASSPLNPYNRGFDDFFYGTLPLFMVRYVGQWASNACAAPPTPPALAFVRLLRPAAEACAWGPYTSYDNAPLVGRFLAGCADIVALLFTFLLGRRLYGTKVGMLALALGALAVFPIQHSHFFAVDNFAACFVVASLYFAVRAAQMGRWRDFALASLAGGLALACKISTWPVSLIIALAGPYHFLSVPATHRRCGAVGLTLRVVLAAIVFFTAFRLTHPYSFMGPGFFGLRLNPQWLEDMREIRRLTNLGAVEIPYAHQWAGRTPVLFSWLNMVIWGMGLPLGLTAWVGWALVGIEILRGHRQHFLPWVWATGFFLYQSTLWFKTMRYVLPVYHVLILFGAYALWRLSDRAWRRGGVRRLALSIPVLVLVATLLWALAFSHVYRVPHTRLMASRWIYENVPQGSVVANEHWDDALPLGIAGYSGNYRWLSTSSDGQMQNYEEDTPWKRDQLYAWLDEADYIFISSNRLYASIPRLALRYPLTTEYYRALFAGELGFELAADFASYPTIGPFQFPDQENPFPLMEATYTYRPAGLALRLPPAEEVFSVYDHPRVLIFRKTAAYSRQRVEEVLGKVDLTKAIVGLRAVNADKASRVIFDDRTWGQQQAGGTWSEMFNLHGVLNTHPGVAAVVWWLAVTAGGWLAFPLLYVALPRLRDRGYGCTRVLALLLVAYLTWLAASLHILPNTQTTIVRIVALLAVIGVGIGWLKRAEIWQFIRQRWQVLVWEEVLCALLYTGWVGVRFMHPDLWHPTMGGEKPMDLAYLNAVIKSTWFPPYNPWFAQGAINYYYFGFVIIGTLIKLTGIMPVIAYNLAVPLLYALTGVGAFSVAYNLFGGSRRGAILAGVMAMLFTVVLGNLGVVHLLIQQFAAVGMASNPSPLPVIGLSRSVIVLHGLARVLFDGASLPIAPGDAAWYWHPSRLIPSATGDPISEFPAFTFLYGDLHAHAIALPLTLLALALAVYWMRAPRPRRESLLLGGLVIGALYPTNTWDYPTYLLLGLAGLALGATGARHMRWKQRLATWAQRAIPLLVLSVLLYLPYTRHYATGYHAFEKWPGPYTPLGAYLWIHGLMLFPVFTFLLMESRRGVLYFKRAQYLPLQIRLSTQITLKGTQERAWHSSSRFTVDLSAFLVLLVATPALVLLTYGYDVALVVVPIACTALALLLLLRMPRARRLLWLMLFLAMMLGLVVEVIVLKGDIGRMNTVFKFYLQAWILLAVTAAVGVAWVRVRACRWQRRWRRLWWAGLGLLIACGALFLPCGIRARAIDRISSQTGPTLDGMAFMRKATIVGDPGNPSTEIPLAGDYDAIRWIYEHVTGSPVIMEGLGQREYLWGSRVSVYTGLPAVVGWRWHQVQQYAVLPEAIVARRLADVHEFYNTGDLFRAREILASYGVRYVYVGEYERAYYNPFGLAKLDEMVSRGWLQVAYNAHGVTIYEVVGQE